MFRRLGTLTLATLLALSLFVPASAVVSSPTPAFVSAFGGTGAGDGQLSSPNGVALDPSRNVYVADSMNRRISKFGPSGGFLKSWGSLGSAEGEFLSPSAVAIGLSGKIYVADSLNNRIQILSASGAFVQMWGWGVDDGTAEWQICTSGCQAGIAGTGVGQFDRPAGLAIEPVTGQVYVSDTWNHRIQHFTAKGQFLGKWGSQGTAEEQFYYPESLALDPEANVFVVEWGNDRLQKFTPDGDFLAAWGWGVDDGTSEPQVCTSGCTYGEKGTGDGQFDNPYGVGVDDVGRVWVADSANDRVQLLSPTGSFMTKWGVNGTGDGEFDNPMSVVASPKGDVYVADAGNDRIQRFALASTNLTIKTPRRAERGTKVRIRGKVISAEGACQAQQKVGLHWDGKILATDTTTSTGEYSFRVKMRRKMMVWVTYESILACASSKSPRRTIRAL